MADASTVSFKILSHDYQDLLIHDHLYFWILVALPWKHSLLFSEPKLLQILNRLWSGCLTNQTCRWPLLCRQDCAESSSSEHTTAGWGLRVGTLPSVWPCAPLFASREMWYFSVNISLRRSLSSACWPTSRTSLKLWREGKEGKAVSMTCYVCLLLLWPGPEAVCSVSSQQIPLALALAEDSLWGWAGGHFGINASPWTQKASNCNGWAQEPPQSHQLTAGGCSLSLKSIQKLELAYETCTPVLAFLSGLCVSIIIGFFVFSGLLQVRSAYLLMLNCSRKIQVPRPGKHAPFIKPSWAVWYNVIV